MNKTLLWVVVAAVVIFGGIALFNNLSNTYQAPSTPSQTTTAPTSQTQPEATSGSETVKEATINVTSSGFDPQTLTVKAGTKVVWTNKSATTVTVTSAVHPTHQVYPPLNLGEFGNGSSVQLVFDKPGTYKYHNHLNPSQTGTVVVTQ